MARIGRDLSEVGWLMDELVKWLPPFVTFGIALLGLRAWYWQLVAKRRFEVAEQAMTVFERANDALSAIRTQVLFGGDERVEIPQGLDAAERAAHRKYGTYFVRLNDHVEAFKSIRLAQVLCELHISQKAADALHVLFVVRHRVQNAAYMLITEDQELNSTEDPEKRAQIRKRIRSYNDDLIENRATGNKPVPTDRSSQELDEARETLSAECRPLLREQTFWEFLWGRPRRAA
jgi:hypothetical protein